MPPPVIHTGTTAGRPADGAAVVYEAHFGFREKPFSLIPDPDFLYLSRGHKLAMSLLEYGLSDQTGFIVIAGAVGSGKTTLIRQLLRTATADLVVGLITNTHPAVSDLFAAILRCFDVPTGGSDRLEHYDLLIDYVIRQYAAGRRCVLIIDEAQHLTAETLEDLRMLSNVNADKDFLLQLILVGQPELQETLSRPELRQFAQRISVFHDLKPLPLEDTIGYVRHRLAVAGGSADLIDAGACAVIHHYTFGIPRLINILCDLALLLAFGEDRRSVDADVVFEALDARQGTGIKIFRSDPDDLPREARKRQILRDSAAQGGVRRTLSQAT